MNKNFLDGISSKFIANKDFCLVKPCVPEQIEKSESGIVVGISKDSINSRPCSGVVIASGDTEKAGIGEVIVFPNTDGLDIKFNDGNYMVIRIESIVGKMSE